MKISEALMELGEIKRKHGDLELIAIGADGDFAPSHPSFCADSNGSAAYVLVDIGPFCRQCHRGCD